MYAAIEKNDVAKVRALLAARRDEPLGLERMVLSPMFLIQATRFGREVIVGELISEGNPVNGGDAEKKTALMHASEKGVLPIVQMLLNADADIGLVSMFGESALQLAKRQGHSDIVSVLTRQLAAAQLYPAHAAEGEHAVEPVLPGAQHREAGPSRLRRVAGLV